MDRRVPFLAIYQTWYLNPSLPTKHTEMLDKIQEMIFKCITEVIRKSNFLWSEIFSFRMKLKTRANLPVSLIYEFSCNISKRTLKGQWAITKCTSPVSTVKLGHTQVYTSPLAQGHNEGKCLFWPGSLPLVSVWFSSGQKPWSQEIKVRVVLCQW